MKAITINTFVFYALENENGYQLVDNLLAATKASDDESILKENDTLKKLYDILSTNNRMGFNMVSLKIFEKQLLVSLSVEYRAIKTKEQFNFQRENFASWHNNRNEAKAGL